MNRVNKLVVLEERLANIENATAIKMACEVFLIASNKNVWVAREFSRSALLDAKLILDLTLSIIRCLITGKGASNLGDSVGGLGREAK